MLAPSPSARLTSRRRPRLKVVGHHLDGPTPHAAAWKHGLHRYRVEVWTHAEWATLHPSERPRKADVTPLPGIGWQALTPISQEEYDDLVDVAKQYVAMMTSDE